MRITKILAIAISLITFCLPAIAQDLGATEKSAELRAQQERRDNRVTQEDVLILVGAINLLSNEAAWNRADDRACDDDENSGSRSLFCALQKASINTLGEYNHRRVALQEVRFAIQDATNNRKFEHRLRDYNNLPETSLSDVISVLENAKERVESRLEGLN